MATQPTHELFVGLDLAQAQEFTALAVLERPFVPKNAPLAQRRPVYALRHLRRFPLGTPYPEVARAVRELLRAPALQWSDVVVDQTGVGSAVVDLLMDHLGQGGVTCNVWRAVITAGQVATTGEGGTLLVPKKELVGVLQVLLATRRLQIPRSLPEAALLVRELETFKAHVKLSRSEDLESWRENDHDDLVFALALASWFGELTLPPLDQPEEDTRTTVCFL